MCPDSQIPRPFKVRFAACPCPAPTMWSPLILLALFAVYCSAQVHHPGGGGGGGGGGGHGGVGAHSTFHPVHPLASHHTRKSITNLTIAGAGKGCRHRSEYYTNPLTRFPMCMGQTDQDLKNGMSIINLINSRGYLPTCRVLQLLMWMAAEVHERLTTGEHFVDVGANIGKPSPVHALVLALSPDAWVAVCMVSPRCQGVWGRHVGQ